MENWTKQSELFDEMLEDERTMNALMEKTGLNEEILKEIEIKRKEAVAILDEELTKTDFVAKKTDDKWFLTVVPHSAPEEYYEVSIGTVSPTYMIDNAVINHTPTVDEIFEIIAAAFVFPNNEDVMEQGGSMPKPGAKPIDILKEVLNFSAKARYQKRNLQFPQSISFEQMGYIFQDKIAKIFKEKGIDIATTKRFVPRHVCFVCGQPETIEATDPSFNNLSSKPEVRMKRCGGCGAMFYCSQVCQKEDWPRHKLMCKLYKDYKTKKDEMTKFPFPFTEASLILPLCFSFDYFGVHLQGFWKYECGHYDRKPKRLYKWSRKPESQQWILPQNFIPAERPLNSNLKITNWQEYYAAREIPLESPACLLLHFPLSLYHIVANICHPKHINLDSIRSSPSKKLTIHYVGVLREIVWYSIFKELSYLLPGIHIEMLMIEPELPAEMDHQTVFFDTSGKSNENTNHNTQGQGSLRITFYKGLYHEVYQKKKLEKPHLIAGLNVGLAGYQSWFESQELMVDLEVPAVFTDFMEEFGQLALSNFHNSFEADSSKFLQVEICPFRAPVSKRPPGLDLPYYENGFLFGVNLG